MRGKPAGRGFNTPLSKNGIKTKLILLNGDILMKNKKEPRLPDAPCTCPYISGRERGSDAVIRKIAPFRRLCRP